MLCRFPRLITDFGISAIFKAILPKFLTEDEAKIAKKIDAAYIDKEKEFPDHDKNYIREKLVNDDNFLRSLSSLEDKREMPDSQPITPQAPDATAASGPKSTAQNEKDDLKKLRKSMTSDITDVINGNFQLFAGKLKIELDRLQANLKDTVERTGDRVIGALSEGPWEAIDNSVSGHNGHSET